VWGGSALLIGGLGVWGAWRSGDPGAAAAGAAIALSVAVVMTAVRYGWAAPPVPRRGLTPQAGDLAQLGYLALHDGVTELANRALFLDRVGHALTRSNRTRTTIGVLYLDLDGLTEVTRRLGSAAGEELLVEVASRLAAAVRQGDTVGRLGGDEFAILAEDVNVHELVAVTNRILTRLSVPAVISGDQVSMGATAGLALGHPGGPGAHELMASARAATYEAKATGGEWYRLVDVGPAGA